MRFKVRNFCDLANFAKYLLCDMFSPVMYKAEARMRL